MSLCGIFRCAVVRQHSAVYVERATRQFSSLSLARSAKPLPWSLSATTSAVFLRRFSEAAFRSQGRIVAESAKAARESAKQVKRASEQAKGGGALQVYRKFSRTYPWVTAFGICFFKGAFADFFVQKIIEKRTEVDTTRTFALALFSGSYCGCAQHFVFNIAFTRIVGTSTKLPAAIAKTFLDFLGHAPFMYLPCYLAFDQFMRFGVDPWKLWERWERDLWNTWCAYIKVWPFVMMVAFTVVPMELRISVLACVSVVWLMVLSCVAHSKDEVHDSEH